VTNNILVDLEVSLFKQKSELGKLSRVGMKVRISAELCACTRRNFIFS
jgi:hypothetical protein